MLVFLRAEVGCIAGWPGVDFHIEQADADSTEDGLLQLLEFLDSTLRLPEVRTGFMLTYDVRQLHHVAPTDVWNMVMQWSCEPNRRQIWSERCLVARIVVGSGISNAMWRISLSSMFFWTPPTVVTYLVEDLTLPMKVGTICYEADEELVRQSKIPVVQ